MLLMVLSRMQIVKLITIKLSYHCGYKVDNIHANE